MLYRYKSFTESINEADEFSGNKAAKGIGNLLKGVFKGFINDIKDEFKAPLEDFTKKIGNVKEKEKVIRITNDYLSVHRKGLEDSINQAQSVKILDEALQGNLVSIYATIEATIESFSDTNYSFEEIFSETNGQTNKLFNSGAKKFKKNLPKFTKNLILSFGKKYHLELSDFDEVKKEDTNTENTNTDDVQQNKTQESINTQESMNMIFESISDDDMDKLKTDIIMWFDKTIYKNTKKSLDVVKNNKPTESTDINSKIDNIPNDVTTHKDSVKNILNKIIDSDKKTMMNIRDMIGLNTEDTPL